MNKPDNTCLYKNCPYVAYFSNLINISFFINVFLENNSSAIIFIVFSNSTFAKKETRSKLTNFCPDENLYECNLLIKSPINLKIYSCGMWDCIILFKNFANLYSGVFVYAKRHLRSRAREHLDFYSQVSNAIKIT